jgi:hypothetical protein
MLYNLRVPASRLEQLRRLAERAGVPPSTLTRQWVTERLDQGASGDLAPDPRLQYAVRLELQPAGPGEEGVWSLMEALKMSLEAAREGALSREPKGAHRAAAIPSAASFLACPRATAKRAAGVHEGGGQARVAPEVEVSIARQHASDPIPLAALGALACAH